MDHPDPLTVVVTGGAGYIGSIVELALTRRGHRVIVIDDLSAGPRAFLPNQDAAVVSVTDLRSLRKTLETLPRIDAVIHCAALTDVAESVRRPGAYQHTNVEGTKTLLEALTGIDCGGIIYSGSASIYAPPLRPDDLLHENHPIAPTSPYGDTKAAAEALLAAAANNGGPPVISLRYFNPVGADIHLRRGPYRTQPTTALARVLNAVTSGECFSITGTNYPTRDGTGLRDYVDVWDLALAHVSAVERITTLTRSQPAIAINLGSSTGTTVLELVNTVQRITRQHVRIAEAPPRPGDVAAAVASIDTARALLHWEPTQTLEDSIRHTLRWLQKRPTLLRRDCRLNGVWVRPD